MKKVTPKMLNIANALFWQYIALLENSDPSDEGRALMMAYRAIAHRMKQLNAAKATASSAKARRDRKAKRDRLIADALDKKIPPKLIQALQMPPSCLLIQFHAATA